MDKLNCCLLAHKKTSLHSKDVFTWAIIRRENDSDCDRFLNLYWNLGHFYHMYNMYVCILLALTKTRCQSYKTFTALNDEFL
jgi:hypothetical protein